MLRTLLTVLLCRVNCGNFIDAVLKCTLRLMLVEEKKKKSKQIQHGRISASLFLFVFELKIFSGFAQNYDI